MTGLVTHSRLHRAETPPLISLSARPTQGKPLVVSAGESLKKDWKEITKE